MTTGDAYQAMQQQLCAVYDEREATNVTDLVFESRLQLRRIDRVLKKNDPLTASQQAMLETIVHELLQNKPVQQVLGEAWFDGMLLKITGKVLIPRPETEELVHWIRTDLAGKTASTTLRLLDIGTGSGCIPIALKRHLPHASVSAIDVCSEALHVAMDNALQQKTGIDFQLLDFLDEQQWYRLGQFTVIVSNPPYIAASEQAQMHERVLAHEPHLALFVPDHDPLLFYDKIARFAQAHLADGGAVYVEINEGLGQAIAGLFKNAGFHAVELRQDLQGKDRMIKAWK